VKSELVYHILLFILDLFLSMCIQNVIWVGESRPVWSCGCYIIWRSQLAVRETGGYFDSRLHCA